jgi:membrane protease subunit HflK
VSARLRGLPGWLSRPAGAAILVCAALAAWLASGVFTVPATSLGVTRLFGAVVDPAVTPGVHWWWPAPVGAVARVEVTPTFTLTIGYAAPDETRALASGLALGRWLTGDTNILELRARVNYRITDPARWLLSSESPRDVMRDVVGSAVTEAASALPVDDLLTSGRLRLAERVMARAQGVLDGYGLGVQILGVNLESIEPPADVIAAFQAVQNAKADRERAVSEAQAYANSVLPVARGESEKRVSEALSFQSQRVNAAQGAAEAFAKLALEHRQSPALLELRLYLETVEKVLPRVKRYVLSPEQPGALPLRIVE